MGDISTWNPVDNSNTTAPPDGWPEGMAPSAVNNSARAMMGAVRRWYDAVSPAIASITSYLPLTGGTLTGPLTAPQVTAGYLHSTGNVVADVDVGCRDLNSSRSVNCVLNLNAAGVTATGTIQGAQLTSSGNINATLDMGARDFFASRNIWASSGTVTAAALVSTGTINATGNITAPAFIGNVTVPANGPVTTGGTVTGGQVTSTGNANVAGAMTAGSLHATGNLQVDASATINNSLYVGGPVTFQNTFDVTGGPCSNIDGTWHIISDARMKTGIADYTPGLEAILALRPCVYRYRPELFGPEEAEKTRYGLVADEVAPVLPEMVGETVLGGRNLSTLNTGPLNFVLINACRDLAAQNAALAARIAALEEAHV